MAFSLLSKSLLSKMSMSMSASPELDTSGGADETMAESPESGFSHLMNKDLYPVREKVVDENCPCDAEPFQLLAGESIEFMGQLMDEYIIALSNYRLFATQEEGFYSVPLGLIETADVLGTKDQLLVLCRDARAFKLSFSSPFKCKLWHERIVESLKRLCREPKSAFAFVHRAYNKDKRMAREDLLRLGEAVVGVAVWEEQVVHDGADTLLSLKGNSQSWRDEVLTTEYERMGMGLANGMGMVKRRPWRITQSNDKYRLCGTYPKLLVVPNSITDEELMAAAKFRMSGRIPAVVWRHRTNGCVIARSSQPLVGVLGWRSPEDEKLLFAISESCATINDVVKTDSNGFLIKSTLTTPPLMQTSCSAPQLLGGERGGEVVNGNGVANGYLNGGTQMGHFSDSDNEEELPHSSVVPKLKVFDLRSYTAALGNRAKGGGCEFTDYYSNCEVQYKGLPNIHAVRKSFLLLRGVLLSDDQINFLSGLENTQWLHYLCQLLSVACEVAGVVNDHAQPILVHCSDGWDRTTQVVALAELMLDPYYRTIKGFKVLVEREWLGYGHKFGERCGLTTEDANQQSPVFLQWLDCVHQLTRQFPCDFEFNENFLLKLGRHVYSSLYGTFLYNSMREREQSRVSEDTTSLWSLLHDRNQDFTNYLYTEENKVLRPVPHIRSMLLWKDMYTASLLIPYQAPPTPTTEPTLPHSPTSQSNSLSSSPSPAHHVPLRQSGCLVADGDDVILDEIADSAEIKAKADEQVGQGSTEVKGQIDVATTEVESGKDGSTEVKGQRDAASPVMSEEEHVAGGCGQEDGVEGVSHDLPNGHLLTSEQRNGLIGGNLDREMANVLTQHSPSTIIEMKDLVHVNDVKHQTNEQGFPPATSLPVVDHPSSPPSNARSHSEPNFLPARTDVGQAHTDMAANGPTHREEKETNFYGQFHVTMTYSVKENENGSTVALGVDGLPRYADPVQKRLREIEVRHKRDVEELRASLRKARLQVAEVVRLQEQRRKEGLAVKESERDVAEGERICGDGSQPSLHSDELPSPSSLTSWDCVDQENEHGVRWIPDHAATHCQNCGGEFWTARRKHHCRSCGGVFCGTCSNFFCPVPDEQLFLDVRVCERCYYRLDGHLKTQVTAPT